MQNINSAAGLRDAILQLEVQQAIEAIKMKEQFHLVCESIKPVNLVKSLFKETAASPDLQGSFLNTSIGLTVGYLSKRLFQGISNSPVKKLLASALQLGITNAVIKNSETFKTLGKGILTMIRHKSVTNRANINEAAISDLF